MILDRPLAAAEQLDLFALPPRTCADCGKKFQTSRPSDRCALCSSLRTGLVGPATVECVVCGVTHQVAVLSPSKLCDLCRADLVLAESNIKADLAAAEADHNASMDALDAALGQADDADLARYQRAVELRESGQHSAAVAQRWQEALQKGDGLTPLLAAYDARLAAARARSAVYARTRVALQEIEAAR